MHNKLLNSDSELKCTPGEIASELLQEAQVQAKDKLAGYGIDTPVKPQGKDKAAPTPAPRPSHTQI